MDAALFIAHPDSGCRIIILAEYALVRMGTRRGARNEIEITDSAGKAREMKVVTTSLGTCEVEVHIWIGIADAIPIWILYYDVLGLT